MLRWIILSVLSLVVLGLVAGASGIAGYFAHREQLQPVHGLAERAIVKGRRTIGMPTETVAMVERIETTFFDLRGTVYEMPNNDFKVGGALALWDEDVLVMNKYGVVHYLDARAGLTIADITVPDNGVAGFLKLAAEKYPDGFTRADALRYNDLEFIDSPAFRGLVLSYTFIDVAQECYHNRISRLAIPQDVTSIRDVKATADDWEVLFDTRPCLAFNESRELIVGYMAGGRVAFKQPNLLYLGSGEFHLEGFYRPDAGIQSDDSDYGKTLEIDITTGESRVFSKGHRNLQGVTLDTEGRLWTTEHGMRGGDELNLILDGENYGWPLENLGTLYTGAPAPTIGEPGRHLVHRLPVYSWLPSAAVSSLAVVDGFHDTWDGDLLVGSLKGRTLYRARIRNERLVFFEIIPIGQRIRDVMQISSEEIALWLDTNELVILTRQERADPLEGLVAGLVDQGMSMDRAEAAHDTLVSCNECHSYEQHVHGAGPSLYKLAGRKIAGTSFADYTAALRSQGGVWDTATLSAYIEAPGDVVEGTAMTGLGLGNAEAAADVTTAFEWLTNRP